MEQDYLKKIPQRKLELLDGSSAHQEIILLMQKYFLQKVIDMAFTIKSHAVMQNIFIVMLLILGQLTPCLNCQNLI